MIITIKNLRQGIDVWKKWDNKTPDNIFINNEYSCIYSAKREGLTGEWWKKTVDRLGSWKAYRGGKEKTTKESLLNLDKQLLTELRTEYEKIKKTDKEPSITEYYWADIEKLFTTALKIRNSPVFASKLCHFIFPNLFIVLDNTLTGVFFYDFVWQGMKDEWERFPEKDGAIETLKNAIGNANPLNDRYPLETKIMELCLIGRKAEQQA